MIHYTDGECIGHGRGCFVYVADINIYAAWSMMLVDCVLFSLFCFKVFKIISTLKAQESSADGILTQAWKSFLIQLSCVFLSMISCTVDGGINYFFLDVDRRTDLMPFFVVDVLIVSFCNIWMLKESGKDNAESFMSHCRRCSFANRIANNEELEMRDHVSVEQTNNNTNSGRENNQ